MDLKSAEQILSIDCTQPRINFKVKPEQQQVNVLLKKCVHRQETNIWRTIQSQATFNLILRIIKMNYQGSIAKEESKHPSKIW